MNLEFVSSAPVLKAKEIDLFSSVIDTLNESVPVRDVVDFEFPQGTDEFGVMTLSHCSDYLIVFTESPQTGDNSHMTLWFALFLVSGGALIGTTVYGKKVLCISRTGEVV